MPFVGFVNRERAEPTVALQAVEGVGGNRLDVAPAAAETAAARGEKRQATIGQGTRIEVVVGSFGELP